MKLTKYLKATIISIAITLGIASSYAKETYTSDISVLPPMATTFLNDNFKNEKIIQIKIESGWLKKTTYDVILTNGIEIDFDRNGNWEEIESKVGNIPLTVLPQTLIDAVNKEITNTKIKSIERKSYGYKIELQNDIELLVYNNSRVIIQKGW